MAMMPNYDLGSRKIGVLPDVKITPGLHGVYGQAVGEAGTSVANALDRIGEIRRREEEKSRIEAQREQQRAEHAAKVRAQAEDQAAQRDAEYAINLTKNYLANESVGHDEDDGQGGVRHIAGKFERSYAEMKRDGTDTIKIAREITDASSSQEWVKSLSPAAKAHYDRKFIFTHDEFIRNAAANDLKLRQADLVEKTKANFAARAGEVAALYGDPTDQAYADAARRNALLNLADIEGSNIVNRSDLDNPNATFADIKWAKGLTEEDKAKKLDKYKDFVASYDTNRVTSLYQAASVGRGIGGLTPQQCLDKAESICGYLSGAAFGYRPDGTAKGTGWLGVHKNANGAAVTEWSMQSDAVKVDGKRIDFPTLVPGLTKEEIQAFLDESAGKKPDQAALESGQQKAVDHANKMISEGKSVWANSGTGKNYLQVMGKDGSMVDASASVQDNIIKARQDFSRLQDVKHKAGIAEVTKQFNERIKNFDDTEEFRSAKWLNQDALNKELDKLVLEDKITQEDADKQKMLYAELIKHRDDINKAIEENKGEWVEHTRVRDGKKIRVFVPFKEGSEKTPNEFKRTFAEINATMPGEKSVWDNPATAMDQLNSLYKLGRIDYKFYEEKIKYGRMLSNDKAKMYYLENFGSKGIEGLLKSDEVKTWSGNNKSLYAKKAGWRGNHKSAAEFLSDAMHNGWGEAEVELTPQQKGKLFDIICDCTAAGIDPTASIREILAPTMRAYADKDLDFRLDKKNGIVEAIIAQGQTSFFGGIDSEPLHPRDPKTKEAELRAAMQTKKTDK